MALDLISTPTIVEAIPFRGRTYWSVNAKATSNVIVELRAAPGVGKSLYIVELVFHTDTSAQLPRLTDEDDELLFGPVLGNANGPITIVKHFQKPLKLRSNKSLQLRLGSGVGKLFVFIRGATAED